MVEGMIAGRGWIALALVTFGTWRPFRVFLGAYLFGGIDHAADESSEYRNFRSDSVYFHGALCGEIIVLALISRNRLGFV